MLSRAAKYVVMVNNSASQLQQVTNSVSHVLLIALILLSVARFVDSFRLICDVAILMILVPC